MNEIAIAQKLKKVENKQGLLSFGNGIENALGVRYTNKDIRLKIKNNRATDEVVLLTGDKLLGLPVWDDANDKVNALLDLPTATPFFKSGITDVSGDSLDITCLTPGQNPTVIASQLSQEPTQIVGVSMKSFDLSKNPENTNYGNAMTRYKLSHLEEIERKASLNFDAYQNSRDVSTEILKIDFIKNGYEAIITQKDALTIRVNAGTELTLTLHLGSRASMAEFFYRQVKGFAKVLRESFPNESIAKSC